MECKEIQRMIVPYIKGELTDKQLYDFLLHVQDCADCREELETYYIVYRGLMQMDSGKDLSTNMITALDEELEGSRTHLRNMQLFKIASSMVYIMATFSAFVIFGINIYFIISGGL